MSKPLTPATALTLEIVDFLESRGHYATRIVTAGIYNEQTNEWKRSGTERGTADIHACVNALHISIEIKRGRDNLRKRQLDVRKRVLEAGGQYIAIKEFSEFLIWYQTFTNIPQCF